MKRPRQAGGQSDKPPVSKNQEIILKITDLSHEGLGVGKYEGYTLFIADALPEELIRARVVKVNRRFGYARLLEILEPSRERVAAHCTIYGSCGGCQLQHLSYPAQLAWKRELVTNNLKRLGGIEAVEIAETLGMAEPWLYRNKLQVPFAESEGRLISGFYARRTNRVIDMQECLIQDDVGNRINQAVRNIAGEIKIPAYDPKSGQGVLRHAVTRTAAATGETMLILVTNEWDFAGKAELVERLLAELPDLTSLVQNLNQRRDNVILGDEFVTLAGADVIYDELAGVRFAISPPSFYQVNPEQTRVLYEKAVEFAQLTGEEIVIDAYCGIGTISLFLAQKAKHVYGVEIVEEAIRDARINAELNEIDNVSYVLGAAEEVMAEWQKEGTKADVIVVDPPRKGCEPALLEAIIAMGPERVVYVSCNPATLARDLGILEAGGYKTMKVQPVDMFPQTVHVECVALMSRIEN